jgi:small-conductance mechanosensitive channel
VTPRPASIFGSAADSLGGFLPRLGGALLLLIVGVLLARLIGRLVSRALAGLGLDALGDRWGIHDVIARAGLPRSLSRLIGRLLRAVLTVVVVFAALSLLGLEALSQSLNAIILFLPRLFAALALVVIGLALAHFVRERLERMAGQMDLRGPIGALVEISIIAVFGILALGQLGVPTAVLIMAAGVLLGGVALTAALAFGLGSRGVVRQVSAGRYLSGAFEIGQLIAVGDVRGRVVELGRAATIVETDAGKRLRIPNSLLLDSVVETSAGPQDGGAEAPGSAGENTP